MLRGEGDAAEPRVRGKNRRLDRSFTLTKTKKRPPYKMTDVLSREFPIDKRYFAMVLTPVRTAGSKSNRSRFITRFQAAIKSFTNFASLSLQA